MRRPSIALIAAMFGGGAGPRRGQCLRCRGARWSALTSRCHMSRQRSRSTTSTSWSSVRRLRHWRAPADSKRPIRRGSKRRLLHKLPGVTVKVSTYAKPRETAADMEKQFDAHSQSRQAGAGDLADRDRRCDAPCRPRRIRRGARRWHRHASRRRRSDVILMNMQYSPRTESMIAVAPYADVMRIVALQHEIPLFDRFAIMKHWSELGTFDLNEITKKIDTAGARS